MAIGTTSLRGINVEEFAFPFNLASAVVAANVGGAVTLDLTAENTMKMAGAGDKVYGQLQTFEDRTIEGIKVGTVMLKGGMRFTIADAETVIVGDTLVGAGSATGTVKALAAIANIALSTSNTFTDSAVNTAINAVIDNLEAKMAKMSNFVVEIDGTTAIAVFA
jgi:hypothetical protein